jgi:hypothetical protein
MDTNFGKLLSKLSSEELDNFCEALNLEYEEKKDKEKIEIIVDHSFDVAVQDFVSAIPTNSLKSTLNQANVETEEMERKILKELYYVQIEKDGLEDFFKKMNKKSLEEFMEILNFSSTAKNIQEMAEDLSEEIYYTGSRYVLQKLKLIDLKLIGKSLTINNVHIKDDLVNKILEQSYPNIKGEEKPTKQNIVVEKRAVIKKGVTHEELHQQYWVDELREWCKEHKLGYLGKKNDFIKRILEYFENLEEETPEKDIIQTVPQVTKKRGRKPKSQTPNKKSKSN